MHIEKNEDRFTAESNFKRCLSFQSNPSLAVVVVEKLHHHMEDSSYTQLQQQQCRLG